MGIADDLYSGSASFGQFVTIIGAVITTLISILLIVAGVADIKHKEVYTQNVNAKVVNSTCQNNSCDLTLQYIVANITYNTDLEYIGSTVYKAGDTIKIYYDPSNPHNIAELEDNPNFGYILIGIGVFLAFVAWLSVWIVRKFKFAAAGAGFAAIF